MRADRKLKPQNPDPFLDSDEIAEKVLQARRGKYRPHDPKEYDRIFQRVIAKPRRVKQ